MYNIFVLYYDIIGKNYNIIGQIMISYLVTFQKQMLPMPAFFKISIGSAAPARRLQRNRTRARVVGLYTFY